MHGIEGLLLQIHAYINYRTTCLHLPEFYRPILAKTCPKFAALKSTACVKLFHKVYGAGE